MERKGQGRTEHRTGLHWGWGLLRTLVLVLSHQEKLKMFPRVGLEKKLKIKALTFPRAVPNTTIKI